MLNENVKKEIVEQQDAVELIEEQDDQEIVDIETILRRRKERHMDRYCVTNFIWVISYKEAMAREDTI